MKLLNEIINPNTVNLTNTQQGVLTTIAISPTPEVAYEATNGADQSVYARSSLRTLGLIRVGDNKAALTPAGQQVIINYNLLDDTGQLTERGQEVINSFNATFKQDQAQENQEDEL